MNFVFDKPVNGLGLTFSAKIADNDSKALAKILDIQERLSRLLPTLGVTHIDKANALSDYIVNDLDGEILYKYPEETLHFSMINFITRKVARQFADARSLIENESWFEKFKEYVTAAVAPLVSQPMTLVIDKIYKNQLGDMSRSLAINGKPAEPLEKMLKEVEATARFELQQLDVPEGDICVEVKQYSSYFAINLFRFLSKTNTSVLATRKFESVFAEINESLRAMPIKLRVDKFALVISDRYLANPHPVILEFRP